MDSTSPAERQRSLEQFRHLLFHLQMECGSVHDLFRFFNERNSLKHFDALKQLDPNLMPQLLAREFVLEARRTENLQKAKEHLETALRLDPQCQEACWELALLSDTSEASMMWYQKSMDACERSLGAEQFHQLKEDFKAMPWKQVELLLWIKAKVNLAETLFRAGYYANAISQFEELLQLDTSDELQLRPYLITALLCEDKRVAALEVSREYLYDGSANWYYCKAFLRFKMEGGTQRSNRLLMRAFKRNLWVAVFLLGLEEMPSSSPQQPSFPKMTPHSSEAQKHPYREGSKKEAVECVRCIAPAFCEDNKMVYWIWENLKGLV